jgi:anhydro-N-acetylmuramic acid kinase
MIDDKPQSHCLRVVGAMSGTSLDGIDWAIVDTDGEAIYGFGPTGYVPYHAHEQAVFRAALGQWRGAAVDAAAQLTTALHRTVLAGAIGTHSPIDLVGIHGQTLAHDPQAGRTLQVGDGQVWADAFQLPVAWDFRSADVAAGGEGAPLAPFFHFACVKWFGAQAQDAQAQDVLAQDVLAPVVILNLGGVANITWVDPTHRQPDADGALLAFDTGPANAPLNDMMLTRRNAPFDQDGQLAAQGRVDESTVQDFLTQPYFLRSAPKSLDRDSFADIQTRVAHLSDADAAATLLAISAAAVAQGVALCPRPPVQVLVTGGGRLNPTMMAQLSTRLACPVQRIEAVGLNGDMLEAQAFAFLAARVARGLPISAPMTTGVNKALCGGRLSRPVAG